MSSAIEERVLSMKFQSDQFLASVDKTMAKLDQLNNKLKLQEGTKGLENLGASAARQHGALSSIADSVSHISDRFKAMGVIGVTALSSITTQAVFAGQQMLKSLTVQPILDGFHEYETNLNAIQTILANTQASGAKLSDVSAALNELNHYSDQTIYNFSEMAKNIGTFTAAGVGLKPAVAAIKGIANLAALSGSNSQQASTAMYQLSQAISSGRVSLEDWNSVVNAGMGGTVFQRALAQNAEKMGTLSKGAVKLKGDMKNVTIEGKSFRDSITAKPGEKSWLTSDVLTRTLAQFTGDLSDAQLKAEGFNAAEIKAIQAQARTAKNAATQVKTLSQLLGTVSESVGSGWAQTWEEIFGNFTEAKSLFTNVNNVLGGFVTASANARNKVLADWKQLGGRKAIIDAISNTFDALVRVIRPIKNAFREIFPATTGKQLADISKNIAKFTENLKIGGTTANNIKRTFAGFFAVIDIGWQIVKKLAGTIFDLLGVATEGSGGILNFTGNIGDFLVGIDKAIKSGTGLTKLFGNITKVLSVPIKLIKTLVGYLGKLVDGFNGTKAADGLTKFVAGLDPFTKLGSVIGAVWSKTLPVLKKVWNFFLTIGTQASSIFGDVGETIRNAFSNLDFGDVLKGLNTGLFAGLVLIIKNFVKGIGNGGGIGGLIGSVSDSFENLTGALGAMQNTLRAATLLEIAAAVGVLTISMNVLSKIDAAGLARASAAISVMFTQLVGSLILFEKISGFAGFAKMPFVAASLILLAAAVDILASAAVKLSGLDWNGLAKGLTGITVILGTLVGALKLMPNGKLLISSGIGMIALAAAIKIMASAVTDLSGLSWEELAKGLIGVAGVLGALGLFTKFGEVNKGGILGGAGLILIAVSIKLLADAMKGLAGLSWKDIGKSLVAMLGALTLITASLDIIPPTAPLAAASVLAVAYSMGLIGDALQQFAQMSWQEIGKSVVELLGALGLITAALALIPPTAPLGAAAILIVALSLNKIGEALQAFSQFSWSEIGKAMVVLAGSLLIIGAAVTGMDGALPGAAALIVISGALAVLAPVLVTLGQMSWLEIGKGLLTLAAALLIIGGAAALLSPVIPSLLGLGIAVGLLGAGMALAGAGVLAFSAGLAALAVSGAAGTAAIVAIVSALLGLLPAIGKALGEMVVAFAQAIGDAGPAIVNALTKILISLSDAIDKASPRIANTFYKLLTLVLETIAKYTPRIVQAGYNILVAFLNGVGKNIGRVVTAATTIIVNFINGISRNLPRIVQAGANLVINFVNGVANAIRSNSKAMGAAGANLGEAVIEGMVRGLAGGVGRIASMAASVAHAALNAAKSVLGIHSPSKEFEKIGNYVNDGFRKGLDGNKGQIDTAFNNLKTQLSSAMKDSAKDVDTLEKRLKRLTNARHKDKDAIKETRVELAQANKEHKAEAAAYTELTKKLNDEHTALGKLATRYDVITKKLDTANQALADAVKTRDDYNKQIKDQYSDIAAPTADTTLDNYISDLQKQINDTMTLSNDVQRLRALGLNDETYQDILSAGTSALPFVNQLLGGGKAAIDQINKLGKQLDSVGAQLGKTASTQLYQAAVDSAKGLVDGLKKQQAAIEAQMDKIADAMVKAIKKKLGIKSPSRVFKQVGVYSAQGLSTGLETGSNIVTDSATNLGNNAIIALRKSLSGMQDVLGREIIDPMPTITPVLDLSQIRKNAGQIGSILPSSTLSVGAAYSQAQSVSNAVRSIHEKPSKYEDKPLVQQNYTQNNYSPKALSSAEIYRGTKNQLSRTKEALAKP
jgi:tape measure domain-containing protein